MGSRHWGVALGVLTLLGTPCVLWADPPAAPTDKAPASVRDPQALAAKIDTILATQWTDKQVTPTALSDDAEFVRRVYLDIAGRIPEVSKVRAFLADRSPDKRQRLVEDLLNGPHYVNNSISIWRALMVPQSNNQQLQFFGSQLDIWLRVRFQENAPYDKMVREVLTAQVAAGGRGVRPQPGVAAEPTPVAFYQANEYKAENLAAATSRLFLGVKLECAQCHDHPFAQWTRDQFWQYAAFFAGVRTQNPQAGAFGGALDSPAQRTIKIPGLDREVEARFLDGKKPNWESKTNAREVLADWMTTEDNPYLARAAVNRLWGHFFGIGVVDPVDDFSQDNPPSHPAILGELARAFVANGHDLKFLIRAITSTRAYQLSSVATDESQSDPRVFARMSLKGLTAEQLFDSLVVATGYQEPVQPGGRQFVQPFGLGTARAEFLNKFANHADKRTEYQTSILQALTLMNGKFVADATSLERSGLLASVQTMPFQTTTKRVETLYLATYSRKPRPEELDRMVKYIDDGGPSGDPQKALCDVFWALLNSSEFILNH